MVYRKHKYSRGGTSYGYFQLEEERNRSKVFGFGSGNFIKLSDEYGNTWVGTSEPGEDNLVYYRFRDSEGRTLTGVSDSNGIILRDQRGRTYKGIVE